ncbi:DUF4097 family beta strand repeat-containing protein [Shewanella schlegeliana]|uniref:DUF4097 family beta strand repeat protein n=1 Tax=Shewanella schlegeliana TaxID=190308 RepID=A0ABS1T358_9GAMM|nr:DUF4097 family beta strand repeat-containing protein [Shewanella schlegeliana]MBL4914252.1 DUF4097 family beta strand repeat protein [Shewanella schlegeliana]MCL1109523.1 DUF4097 family beta strand repeat-containing protein [Shewanella schlegeliana]GIU33683.1 hypothetical protein TUM4433_28580 [Shewanella schlegeliana]
MKPLLKSTLMASALLLSHMAIAGEAIEQQQTVEANPVVKVKVQRGSVSFKSWDKNEIAVKGTLDDLSEGFVFSVKGNKVLIEDTLPRQYNGSNKEGSELVITLPSNLRLEAEGVSADYHLDALNGKLEVSSVSGNIKANDLSDKTLLQTVSGDISTRSLAGKSKLQTVSGDIKDTQSSGTLSYQMVSGELAADTQATKVTIESVSGDVTIALDSVDTLAVKTVSGDLELSLNSLLNRAKLGSVSGDIEVNFLGDTDVSFNINGGPSGKISNKLTEDKVTKEKYSPQSYLKFQTGDGRAELNASTISGKIELLK